jgi:hypothetical protein
LMNIATPKTRKDVRSFIGMVNYYRDMWIRRSHILAPLAKLTSKTTPWKWGEEEQNAFDTMKKVMSRETLLTYPDFNKEFVIHTDASHAQLGAVISQDGRQTALDNKPAIDGSGGWRSKLAKELRRRALLCYSSLQGSPVASHADSQPKTDTN